MSQGLREKLIAKYKTADLDEDAFALALIDDVCALREKHQAILDGCPAKAVGCLCFRDNSHYALEQSTARLKTLGIEL